MYTLHSYISPTVANALNLLEAAIQRLVDALAHRPSWVSTEDTHDEQTAVRQICAAYSTIDYAMEDEVGSSIVCLGVADVFKARRGGQRRESHIQGHLHALKANPRLPKPHTEDVIDDVFNAIEHHPEWRQEYDDLCVDLGKTVVNTWGGFWISHSEGRSSVQQVPVRRARSSRPTQNSHLQTPN